MRVVRCLSLLCLLSVAQASPTDPRIGVWTGPGSWEEGRAGLVAAVGVAGATAVELGPTPLTAAQLDGLDAVILPGGWAPQLLAGLGDEGARALDAFVRRGGGCLAICASAYLVADEGRWEDAPTLPDPWSWFPGRAVGPLTHVAPWPQRAPVRLQGIPGEHPLQTTGELLACYYGGPALEPRGDATPLLRYPDGGLAAVASTHGMGRVIVFGPHLEVGPEVGLPPRPEATRLLAATLRWIARARAA